MARRRTRVLVAKRRVLRDVIEQLERDRAVSDLDDILAIDSLLVEFRRRAGIKPSVVLPGQEALPGMGLFKITFVRDPRQEAAP
jgi:hypothetical protein